MNHITTEIELIRQENAKSVIKKLLIGILLILTVGISAFSFLLIGMALI